MNLKYFFQYFDLQRASWKNLLNIGERSGEVARFLWRLHWHCFWFLRCYLIKLDSKVGFAILNYNFVASAMMAINKHNYALKAWQWFLLAVENIYITFTTSFFYIYVMVTSFFYIYVMAFTFYIDIYLHFSLKITLHLQIDGAPSRSIERNFFTFDR